MLKIFSCFAVLAVVAGRKECCKIGYNAALMLPTCEQYCPEEIAALIAMHPAAVVFEQSCCEFGMSQMLPYCTKYCGFAELKAMQLASELRVGQNGAGQKIALEPKDLPAGHPAASILEKECCGFGMAGMLPYCNKYCDAELKAKAAPVLAVPEQKKVLLRDDPVAVLDQKPVEAAKKPDPDDDDEPPKKTAQ